jgi:4-hydroxybenzoate polyprenyltransferase
MADRILKLIDWLLFTSLFTAFCATGLCMSTERLVSGRIPSFVSPLHLLIFGATLMVYNIHILVRRYTPERSELYEWTILHKYWLYFFAVLGLVACIASSFFLPRIIVIIGGGMGLLAFAYSIPVLPFKNLRRIRDIGIVKILVLASVWTSVTTILPILYLNKPISSYPFEIFIRLVFISTLCIAFDIRDIETDASANVHTVPVLIGIKKSHNLMNIGIILFILLGAAQYLRIFHAEQFAGIFITALVTKWVLEYVHDHPSDRVYMGLVDGLMLLYAALALLH